MKQIKFLLSLAVALLIVVPVLAQDAAWGVSGDASATYKYNSDGQTGEDDDSLVSSAMDDVTINVKFNAAGDVSPYIKFQYDANDENRFWLGGSFTKGNFKGEVNVKFDGSVADTTFVNEADSATTSITVPGAAAQVDVDTAWASYTMGAFEFKFDKGGVWGTGDTFKTTYTMSDMMKFFIGLSDADLADGDYGAYKGYYGTNFPLVQVGTNVTAGKIAANADVAFAMIAPSSASQIETALGDMKGKGYNFLAFQADVTATLGEGMSVKVYGAYVINGDTFANDSGISDAAKPNEAAAKNDDLNGWNDATGMKAGLEAKAFNATLCAEYTSTMSGLAVTTNENAVGDAKKTADTKLKLSAAYDLKVGEMTITPKFEYVDNMDAEITKAAAKDLNPDVDMAFTLKAAISF